ncbi:MAG: HD domain-containing protein, partial [Bdellovibrionales bacterium]|nr:HD domain-containing protein [Bdellovibrionales bacterium]
YTDYALYEHLAKSQNPWAKRITERRPFKMLFELHSTKDNPRPEIMKSTLEDNGIETILANSRARLSNYHSSSAEEKFFQIYVVDQYDKIEPPYPIEESTEIFQKYEEIRRIERLYVAPENFQRAEDIIYSNKL